MLRGVPKAIRLVTIYWSLVVGAGTITPLNPIADRVNDRTAASWRQRYAQRGRMGCHFTVRVASDLPDPSSELPIHCLRFRSGLSYQRWVLRLRDSGDPTVRRLIERVEAPVQVTR